MVDMKSQLTEMTAEQLDSVVGGYVDPSAEPPPPSDEKSYRVWYSWYLTYGGGSKALYDSSI